MANIFVNHLCFFCDEIYPHPSVFIGNYSGIWICHHCDNLIFPINIHENEECCVCLENKNVIKLPTCIHKLCLECCKTIYFGSTPVERPLHWREISIESPNWPFEINEDDKNDPEYIKRKEYDRFNNEHFDIETKSYDELIVIRNNLILERPQWMNTEDFINYENCMFKYHTESVKLEKEWNNYNENKTKGNNSCPLCRAKSSKI